MALRISISAISTRLAHHLEAGERLVVAVDDAAADPAAGVVAGVVVRVLEQDHIALEAGQRAQDGVGRHAEADVLRQHQSAVEAIDAIGELQGAAAGTHQLADAGLQFVGTVRGVLCAHRGLLSAHALIELSFNAFARRVQA